MSHFQGGIRQYHTHHPLVGQVAPPEAPVTGQAVDAIVVPAARPAANLDHAVTLARAAKCWLLVVCSHHVRPAEVWRLLAERSFKQAIVVGLPTGYQHELLHFPALLSLKEKMPEACGTYVTDLSAKRNVALVLARMLRWRRIFFLDDDIRDISYPDLQDSMSMLGAFPSVGMRVTNFPDNSVVCHANRATGASQGVFVSGAALAVDTFTDIGFFPDIYNEDWFFFYDYAARGKLGTSGRKATQLLYYPFADPQRAAWQEFGDVLAEGLYGLLHLNADVANATRDYWDYFLKARRSFLEAIKRRSHAASPEIRSQLLRSVDSALNCLETIRPELCELYIRMWRHDLRDWKRRVAEIPVMPSIEAALLELDLSPSAEDGMARRIHHRHDDTTDTIPPGRVVIPPLATLNDLSALQGALLLNSAAMTTAAAETDPTQKVLLSEADGSRGLDMSRSGSPVPGPGGHGRHRKNRFTIRRSGLSIIRSPKQQRRSVRLAANAQAPVADAIRSGDSSDYGSNSAVATPAY
jgi:hypothetical protein